MRIAQVLTASTGGIGRHVASLVPRLTALGHDVTVYAPAATAATHGLDARPLRSLFAAGARTDLIHAHGLKAGAYAVAATRLGGPPLVVTLHNPPPARDRRGQHLVGTRLLGFVAGGAELVLGASTDLVIAAEQRGARRARLGPVAAPTLDLAAADPAAFLASLGLAVTDRVVLTVGRLAPQKNLGMVVTVAHRLASRPDVVFVVVGEGPERDRLTREIAGSSGRVLLAGERRDVASAYAAADVVLLTSGWEARALVAQEALVAGVPLVATDVGGIPELVGEAAMLVPTGDVAEAAAAIARLLDDPAERSRFVALGRTRAQSWPDENGVAELLAETYAEVVLGLRD